MNDYSLCRNDKKMWLVNNPQINKDVSSIKAFSKRQNQNQDSEISSTF